VTALESVQAELSDAMVPWPDDYVDGLSPQAALLLLRQMAMATMKVVTGATVALEMVDTEDIGAAGEVLNGVAAAIAGPTHALVALEVLPPEAEEALANG
jgi:hypothetical protein